ncbi:hypothetical protein [Polaromonas sp. YR568]|uniref:hypothetical protein n=1 Tax=Polaromonas sp. YR568 TaxID=1855301 RepID=UPI00398C0309
MHISSAHWRRGAAALLLAGLACASHAQYTQYGQFGTTGGARGHRNGEAQADGQAPPRTISRWEQVSRRLYDMRVQLRITREQGPAWDNFRGRFLDMATSGPSDMRIVDEQTAKDAFQFLLVDAQRRSNLLATLDATAQALLAQFSPEQMQLADRALPPLLAEFGGSR